MSVKRLSGNMLQIYATVTLLLSLVILSQRKFCRATSFNLHVVETLHLPTDAEIECRSLGYDGLAILSYPEVYHRALALTAEHRANQSLGHYIGLHYNPDTDQILWDDGTPPAQDTPWYSTSVSATTLYGRMHFQGKLFLVSASDQDDRKRQSICGNYKRIYNEVEGTTLEGQQPIEIGASLSETTSSTFLACAASCGRDYRCRVATYHLQLLTCTTLGPNSYTNFTVNNETNTFLRNGFFVPELVY